MAGELQALPTGVSGPVPVTAGIGLRTPHVRAVVEQRPALSLLEVHSENYFAKDGPHLSALEALRSDYPLSLHGVGLSLGSACDPERRHLRQLRRLVDRFEPALVSEHLSWGAVDGLHLNDLLPVPYTAAALDRIVESIERTQEFLGRPILIENVSSYVEFRSSTMTEWEFLAETAHRSGCGILLDVNNVHVSACNHGFDARTFIDAIPADRIGEVHLGGHSVQEYEGHVMRVDTHDNRVCGEVWALYARLVARTGPVATIVEWDTLLPELGVLLEEAALADAHLRSHHALAA
jgi:uncharacterized protein (UPF0276 family)